MKKYIITIIVILIILAMMAGAIFLADKFFYVHGDENVVTQESYSANGIETVTVSLEVGYIEIVKRTDSNSFTVSTVGVDTDFYSVSTENGELSVSSEEVAWYNRALYDHAGKYGITIGIPADFSGEISLDTDAGNISVTGASSDSLNIRTDAGSISVSDASVSKLDIYADVGDINVSADASAVRLETDVGNISFTEIGSEMPLSSLSVTADVGNIDVILSGVRDEYKISAKTDVGNCNVTDGGDGVSVDLLSDVGNINVKFGR